MTVTFCLLLYFSPDLFLFSKLQIQSFFLLLSRYIVLYTMACFGEIVEPSTRTAWEDWDDWQTISQTETTPLKWKSNELNTTAEISTLFILEGRYLSDVIKLQAKEYLQLVDEIPEVSLKLYKFNKVKYVCTIYDYNLVNSSEIIELLKSAITDCKDVITVQVKPITEYQTSVRLAKECIIKTISTSLSQDDTKLEQPNIISGLSAGAICLRKHLGKSGIAYVCFVDHMVESNIKDVQTLLKELSVLQDTNTAPSTILDSNLYI